MSNDNTEGTGANNGENEPQPELFQEIERWLSSLRDDESQGDPYDVSRFIVPDYELELVYEGSSNQRGGKNNTPSKHPTMHAALVEASRMFEADARVQQVLINGEPALDRTAYDGDPLLIHFPLPWANQLGYAEQCAAALLLLRDALANYDRTVSGGDSEEIRQSKRYADSVLGLFGKTIEGLKNACQSDEELAHRLFGEARLRLRNQLLQLAVGPGI